MLSLVPRTFPEEYSAFLYAGGFIEAWVDYEDLLAVNNLFGVVPMRLGPARNKEGRFILSEGRFKLGLYVTKEKLEQLQRDPNEISLREALNELERELLRP